LRSWKENVVEFAQAIEIVIDDRNVRARPDGDLRRCFSACANGKLWYIRGQSCQAVLGFGLLGVYLVTTGSWSRCMAVPHEERDP